MSHETKNEAGIAHVGLIVLIVAVLGVGAFAYWRVSSRSNQAHIQEAEQSELADALPSNLEGIKTEAEIKQLIGTANDSEIIELVLEQKDGSYIYKLILGNGKKLVINALTGEILSEESTDVSDDEQIPSGVTVTISSDEAYRIAAAQYSNPIKKIEKEVEDKKVIYKIEYQDGSKIEINAADGSIVKSEFKSESESEHEDKSENEEEQEDEHESEEENHE